MWIWLLVLILMGIGGVAWWSKRQVEGSGGSGRSKALTHDKSVKKSKKKSSAPRTLLNLQIDDIVSHFEVDYIVRAKATFEEDGEQWFEYMLEGGPDGTVWLNILPNGDDVDAQLYRTVSDLFIAEDPQKTLIYQGRTYRLTRKGTASADRESATTGHSQGTYRYFAYDSDDGGMLSVEARPGGHYEVSVGESIRPFALQILPGDEIAAQSELGL